MAARLKEKYLKEIKPKLKSQFGLKNDLEIPRLTKIVINMGVGSAVENKTRVDAAVKNLTQISGQKPVVRKARKAISTFKLREGMPIGCSVTLRRERMWEFLDRLVAVALPRVRDFRGLPNKGFDGRGNLSIGLKEQIIFPEIDYDKVDKIRGMGITIVTSSESDTHAKALLDKFNFPFRK